MNVIYCTACRVRGKTVQTATVKLASKHRWHVRVPVRCHSSEALLREMYRDHGRMCVCLCVCVYPAMHSYTIARISV